MPNTPVPTQGPLTINVTVTAFVPLPSPASASGPVYPNGLFSDATFEVDPGSTTTSPGRPSSRNSWVSIDLDRNGATHRPYVTVGKGARGNPNGINDLTNGIILHFTIKSATADTYVPLNISFVQYEPSNPNNVDANGTLTFPPNSISIPPASSMPGQGDDTLEVFNRWTGHNGSDFRWRFFLLIKRVGDGAIGIIDPDLENEF